MNNNGFEIERKYLIGMPDHAFLERNAQPSRIEQTYLCPPDPGVTARVRKRGLEGAWTYTHTRKIRLNDLRRLEDERVISEEEYLLLLQQADPRRRVIRKTRWVLPWKDQMFEIDVFPFWKDRALMEIELTDEEQQVELPPAIRILREVTGDPRYTNSSLSLAVPMEDIEKGNET